VKCLVDAENLRLLLISTVDSRSRFFGARPPEVMSYKEGAVEQQTLAAARFASKRQHLRCIPRAMLVWELANSWIDAFDG